VYLSVRMCERVYLCPQSNQRARWPTPWTVIGWLYKTPGRQFPGQFAAQT